MTGKKRMRRRIGGKFKKWRNWDKGYMKNIERKKTAIWEKKGNFFDIFLTLYKWKFLSLSSSHSSMAPALILPHLISFPLLIYPTLYPSPPPFYTSIFSSSLLLSSSSHLALPSNHSILFLFFLPTRFSMNLLHSLSVLLHYTYPPFLIDLSSFFCFSLFFSPLIFSVSLYSTPSLPPLPSPPSLPPSATFF